MRIFSLVLFVFSSFLWASSKVVLTVPLETDLSVEGALDTTKAWMEMIQGTKKSLDIEQFYVSTEKGEALEPVLEEIKKAAERGVKIRLLVDKKFYGTYPDSVNDLGKKQNIETRTVDYNQLTGGVQHAKYIVADNSQFYIGSANFDWRALSHIHEVGLVLEDATLSSQLTKVFQKDWDKGVPPGVGILENSDPLSASTDSVKEPNILVAGPKTLIPSGIPFSFDRLSKLISEAKKSLKLQVYEYSTKIYGESGKWKELEKLLTDAAKRGVAVQVMVDQKNMEKSSEDLKVLAKTKGIEVKTVKIPQFSEGEIAFARLIHSKYLLVDDETYWVGTDNWSKSYFFNSRGVGIIGSESGVFDILKKIYQKLWESNYATPLLSVNCLRSLSRLA